MAIRKPKAIPKDTKTEASIKKNAIQMIDREHWLQESAYYLAEARGFISGHEQNDWQTAEEKYHTCFA